MTGTASASSAARRPTAIRRVLGFAGKHRALLVVVGALAVAIALDWSWLDRFRDGYVVDIDEAGYVATAFDLSSALGDGALSDFHDRFQHHGPAAAPLVPTLTTPIHLVLGEGIMQSYLVQSLLLILLAACVWGISRRFVSPGWAALAVIVVLGTPELIDYARTYHLVLAPTALFAASLYALLRSERLQHRSWALAWGAAMGLAALARTMVVGFLPGLVLAAVVGAWTAREPRRERLVNLSLGLALSVALAALWWLENWRDVLDYLAGGGFGDALRENREPDAPARGPSALLTQELTDVLNTLYVPLALVLGIALVAGGIAWRRRTPPGTRDRIVRFARSEAALLAIPSIAGFVVLLAVKTPGTGFSLPLLPPLVVLAVAGIARMPRGAPRAALATALTGLAIFNTAVKSGHFEGISGRVAVDPPRLAEWVVTDGQGVIQRYVTGTADYGETDPTEPLAPVHRRWLPYSADLAQWLLGYAKAHGRRPIAMFGELDLLHNTNTLALGAQLRDRRLVTGRLLAIRYGDSVAAYRRQLEEPEFGQPNFLILTEPPPRRVARPVSPERAAAAARALGFEPVRSLRLPDGRRGKVLWLERGPVLDG